MSKPQEGATKRRRVPAPSAKKASEDLQQVPEPVKVPAPPRKPRPRPPAPRPTVPPVEEVVHEELTEGIAVVEEPAAPTPGATQIAYKEMRTMTAEQRLDLYKNLNQGNREAAIHIIKRTELPKQMVMRKSDAEMRELIPKKAPTARTKLMYCPYCVDYMPFHSDTYSGYTKCIGCGISTMDYYTKADNGLFGH